MNPMKTLIKKCRICGEVKERNKKKILFCKKCNQKYSAKWSRENVEKNRAKARKYYRKKFKVKPENYNIKDIPGEIINELVEKN